MGLNETLNATDIPSAGRSRILLYVFSIYYCLVFIAGIFGNALIVTSVFYFKKMRTTFHVFLVNLAISDVMFTILTAFDSATFLNNGEWVFGEVFCKLENAMIETSYTVSVVTLTTVALERYNGICHPVQVKRTFKHAIKLCGFVWLFSALFCSCLFYSYTQKPRGKGGAVGCSNDNWSAKSRLFFYMLFTSYPWLSCASRITSFRKRL